MSFDAHTHLDFPEFDADRNAVVARARAAGVSGWVIAGSDHTDWDRTVRVAAETGGIAVLGVHPWETATMDAAALRPHLDELSTRPCAGIGEIGLDALHAKDDASRRRQREAFRAQLAIARARDLPVVFHGVRAWPELLRIAKDDGLPRAGGMAHAWSGPPELIERCVALGLYVSVAPIVLRDRAKKARASVAAIPAERLLIETDCPNMAPLGVARGEPAHLVAVAAEVAALRRAAVAQIAGVTDVNARRLFALS